MINIDQDIYNGAISIITSRIIYENNQSPGDFEINNELINNILFNSEHSIRNLQEPNKAFYLFLKNRLRESGNEKVILKDIDTIYNSLIFNNINTLNFENCNIGINENINTFDKDYMCIALDNIHYINFEYNTFSYPIYVKPGFDKTISIKNCILDSLIIQYNSYTRIYIEDSFIENLYINFSTVCDSGIYDSTIKNIHINNSIFKAISAADDYDNVFDNIFCYKSIIDYQKVKKGNTAYVSILMPDYYKKNTSSTITFYKGDLSNYDIEFITKIKDLELYTAIDIAIYL